MLICEKVSAKSMSMNLYLECLELLRLARSDGPSLCQLAKVFRAFVEDLSGSQCGLIAREGAMTIFFYSKDLQYPKNS